MGNIYKPVTFKNLISIQIALLGLLLFFFPTLGVAEESSEEIREGLDHILGLVNGSSDLNPEILAPVLAFIESEKIKDKVYHFGARDNAKSAYNEFDVHKDLRAILHYAYNPKIPTNVFRPTTVRMTEWIEINGGNKDFPKIWEKIPFPSSPIVIKGVEYEESTPERATGACYGYTLERAMAAYNYQGKNVFISISKQKGNSQKGKKGACLGGDENWDYVYTGEDGITRQGLGWADTHIYNASSISIFYEIDKEKPFVRGGVFKWIEAGWAGLNLVKSKHIKKGISRFAQGFTTTIHHPSLPEPERLVALFDWVERLPRDTISTKVNDYLRGLRTRYAGDEIFSKKPFGELIEDGNYASRMTREQMESVLALECMKWVLGRDTVLADELHTAPDPRGKLISKENHLLKPIN
jgi:hypothetical protein